MNLDQERRLEKIFRENSNQGVVIAITGGWGVGKTFAWNKFLKERAELEKDRRHLPLSIRLKYPNIFNKKYSYVSLFGIESLADLKVAISTNMSCNYFNEESIQVFETPKFLKRFLSAIRDVKVSGSGGNFSINSSARIFEAVLYSQVKDAIICLDDFERMSKKLDIQDVMGLANQLKLERNCQVILILDESKTDGENNNKYAEYKEKLIDESIKINSVEPLIRENTKEIDEPLVDLMVKFANELEIHNFRFFQKVIKLYKQFREQLPKEVAYSTKKIILIRILQGYFIEDFSEEYEFGWEDIKLVLEEKQVGWSERKRKTYESLKSIAYDFIHSDEWLMEFKKWFDQSGEPDFTLLHDLANSTMISEKNNKLKDDFHKLCEDFWGIRVDQEFPKKFYSATQAVIGLENLNNLTFALKILEVFKQDITFIEKEICEWIKDQKDQEKLDFYIGYSIDDIRPIFKKLIEEYQPEKGKLPKLVDAVFRKYIEEGMSKIDELSIENASRKDWERLLFKDITQDARFNTINSSYVVQKILDRTHDSILEQKIRSFITEIYKEKAEKESFYKEYMEYLILRLDN